ncbi:MAG: hypothetical protein P1U62_13320 [Alteraurantiacibacter sp. bin_em_oilr2.035]|nr:hypothetical protein [Alteraurantiacibacter sp. bin_em_oilr2.035]
MKLEEIFEGTGGKAASMAYWNALRALRNAWHEVFEEDLPTEGNNAKDAYTQALERVRQRLKGDKRTERRFRSELGLDDDDELGEALLEFADLDALSPNEVKASILAQCEVLGDGRHELRQLLRPVLDALFEGRSKRQARVGANRHWPRLLLYLRELEAETDWEGYGQGVKLMNSGGRGPVAAHPTDPSKLAVRIDTSNL